MDPLQTIAFLQWLTDEQPFDTWHKEGLLDQRAWIEANGFDPAIVLAGIEGLEQRNLLPSGFEDLLSGALISDAKNRWIKAAQELLIRQKSLMELAGGAGSTLKEFRLSYQKSLNNINKHTDPEIEKEIEAKIERQIEHQIVEGLNKEFPKYTDEWSIGATAAKQDYKEKTINENQKSFLTAHGITINKWSGYTVEGETKGYTITFKHGGFITIEKANQADLGDEITATLGAQSQYNFCWSESNYDINNNVSWPIFSESFIFVDQNKICNTDVWWETENGVAVPVYYTGPAEWGTSGATSVLQKEEISATKVNKTIESPYVKLALKYDLGDKRYSNLASVYDAIKYIQKAKFQDFSKANKIKFSIAMIVLEYDLVTKRFSKYQRLWLTSKHIYEALDTPDKIYQKSFALWWIRGYIKIDKGDSWVERNSYNGGETFVQIEVTNKKTGQEEFIDVAVGPGAGGHEVARSANGWNWTQIDFGYSEDHIKKQEYEEKQSKIFQQLQKTWPKEQILYNNVKRAVENPILDAILHHEVHRYAKDDKYYQANKLLVDNEWSFIQNQWQKECKTLPWLNLVTAQSSILLLKRLNSVDFKALSTRLKISLLCDLYYTQNKFKPYNKRINAFYCGYNRYINKVGRWLHELNKISTELVAIAWRQIVAGTYRINTSQLPIYQQLINRYVIETIAKQNPTLIYANKSGISVQGNDVDVLVNKEPIFVSDSQVKRTPIFDFSMTDGKGTKSYLFPTTYTLHQFALRWERKWFASTQELWAEQAYNQIRIFDIWYRQLTCFPLMVEILRHDLLHSKDWNKAINNGVLQYLHKNKIFKGLPSLGKINQTLLLLEEIDINGITREQKRWLHRQSKILQLSVFLDIVALRTTVAVFIRRHRSLIKQLNNAAQTLEKVTPDRFYQHSINKYIYSQLKAGTLEYNHYYKIPDTEDQVEILKEENSNGNLYDVVISLPNAPAGTRGYTNVDVSKTSNGWVANYIEQDKVFYLNNINIDQVDLDILNRWHNSKQEKVAIDEWGQIALFYEHTKWLFSLAYIPGILKRQSSKRFKQYDKYNWVVDNAAKLTRDSNYFFNLDFRRLSTRKKVMMISDYALFATYKLPSLEQRVGEHRKEEGKAPIAEVYRRLNRLAKVYVQITFAEIYQREFDYVFNVPKWKRTLNRPHDIIISKEYNTSTDSEYYNIEIYNDKGAKDLIATKQQVGWEVESLNFFAYGDISRGGNFNFYYTTGLDPIRQLTISGQWKGSISINTNKQAINIPSFRSLKELKKEYQSLKYLSGFVKNTVINSVAHKYIRRHHKIDQIVKWLPSLTRLEYTTAEARKINFKAHKEGKKILILDYYRAAYFISKRYQQLSAQEKKFLSQDNRLLLDLTSFLQSRKIIPGTHGRIDDYFHAYAKDSTLIDCIFMVKQDIFNIRNPQPHKRKWKQWKTWNERIDSAITLDRQIFLTSHVEKKFFTIEDNALSSAYTTYTDSKKSKDSSKQSLRYAESAYINSLISQDLFLNNKYNKDKAFVQSLTYDENYDVWYDIYHIKTPKGWSQQKTMNFADEATERLARDAEGWIFYREIMASKKLFHITNDRFARKLRLEQFLIKNILEDRLANYGINQYSSSYNHLRKALKHGHLYDFFVDLGLAVWDLVKAPFLIAIDPWIYFFKDGDGFFNSIDKGMEAGFHSVKKSINYLAVDVKDLFLLLDGLLLDVAWLGTHTLFFWVKDTPILKKIDHGIMESIFYVEMGSVFIAKSILEMPLTLSKDVNKILIGLVFVAEGKITIKQMISNDLKPLVDTIDRLTKFTYHLFTNPKIIKEKAEGVYSLLKFMKEKKEIKYVKHMAKVDRNTRRRLHKDTFGIIKSPFQKFKQRHATQYHYLQKRNALLNENGYFNTHADAAFGEVQLKAIYNAQVKLNQLSNKTDYQKATYQLQTQFNIDREQYTTKQQLAKFQKFKSDNSQKQSELVKHFIAEDFVTYFNISANLKSVKNEDKHDIHGYLENNKLHVADFLVNRLNNWMNTVVQRQLGYISAYDKIYRNHPKYAADLLELDELSALFAAIKKEQKTINSEWKLWGEHDGKVLFLTLTNWVLPGFQVVKTDCVFGLNLPFTVIGSDGKMMSKAQQKKIQTYDNKHHIGEKLFEMIMWTIFLKKSNFKHPQRLPNLLWFTDFKPLDPLSPLDPYYNKISESYKKREKNHIVKTYKQDYHGFVNTYSYYRRVSKTLKSIFTPYLIKNSKTFHDLLQYQVKSLKTYNAKLKKFSQNTNVTGLYKSLFQQVVQYDYNKKIYRGPKGNNGWLHFMQQDKQKQLNYLQEDIYVLTYDAEVEHETVTIGDVLKTFTTKGEKNTNEIYGQLVAPPQHQQSNAAIPSLKTLEREIRVNPINVFKNYEFLKHIGKALANKTAKAEAKKAKDIAIIDGEQKEESILNNQLVEEIDVLKSDSLTLIEDDAQTEIADMESFIEEEESFVMNEIEADIDIIDEL